MTGKLKKEQLFSFLSAPSESGTSKAKQQQWTSLVKLKAEKQLIRLT